jgi:segregation and condensation protein A
VGAATALNADAGRRRRTSERGAEGASLITGVAAPAVDLDLDLDVFDGPFDLLVTLILRDEIDIWEVRVSRIIAEYVVRLADSGEFDLDVTSQFVVLVAALLEMKSRLLLEQEVDEDLEELDPDEAARLLVDRLVRYGCFKNVAGALSERWGEHAGRIYRTAPVPAALLRRPAPAQALAPTLLAVALSRLLAEPPLPDASHITDLAVTLVEELRRLRVLLDDERPFTFAEVAPAGRIERAVTFFALLELHARGEARLRQRQHFGDIVVTPVAAAAAALG